MKRTAPFLVVLMIIGPLAHAQPSGDPWTRHTIDNSSHGADGVRMKDVNGDGRLDITTGWEEGGVVRVYLQPSVDKVGEAWPAVTVGKVKSAEDVVFADLDGDGAVDVVSSCEGNTRTMFVHWAPKKPGDYLTAAAWKTQEIPATKNRQSWMFAVPIQIDGNSGIDLVVASKGDGASIGWLEAPADARDLDAWTYHKLYDATWIMSLRAIDLDGDGDQDVLASDRKGKTAGVLWLENPGASGGAWKTHRIGADGCQVMFIDVADLDRDGDPDVLAAIKNTDIAVLLNPGDPKEKWTSHTIQLPAKGIGTSKAVRAGDVNRDGRTDIVFSCEDAHGPTHGMFWLSFDTAIAAGRWKMHAISGAPGVKFDRIELIDLDGDGDLDPICCEERDQLGVFWYENPTR